jgi:regulator of CtrA degradation
MTDETPDRENAPEMVHIANRLATSENFQNLFQEGMALVEETALYLDGDGRTESKLLERPASLAYATESMRLTTRLMQLASWLLLQRAVNEGEMSREQAASDKNKVRLEKLSSPQQGPSFNDMPESLKDLVNRSVRLQERVVHLDQMLYGKQEEVEDEVNTSNPVEAQLNKLHAAFGRIG